MLLPTGAGFLNVEAGARGASGDVTGYARAELGAKPLDNLALFAFAEAQLRYQRAMEITPAWIAGVGARVSW